MRWINGKDLSYSSSFVLIIVWSIGSWQCPKLRTMSVGTLATDHVDSCTMPKVRSKGGRGNCGPSEPDNARSDGRGADPEKTSQNKGNKHSIDKVKL